MPSTVSENAAANAESDEDKILPVRALTQVDSPLEDMEVIKSSVEWRQPEWRNTDSSMKIPRRVTFFSDSSPYR